MAGLVRDIAEQFVSDHQTHQLDADVTLGVTAGRRPAVRFVVGVLLRFGGQPGAVFGQIVAGRPMRIRQTFGIAVLRTVDADVCGRIWIFKPESIDRAVRRCALRMEIHAVILGGAHRFAQRFEKTTEKIQAVERGYAVVQPRLVFRSLAGDLIGGGDARIVLIDMRVEEILRRVHLFGICRETLTGEGIDRGEPAGDRRRLEARARRHWIMVERQRLCVLFQNKL